jgi:superfamily II DNA or RNA helicase
MNGFCDLELDKARQNQGKQRAPFPHQMAAFEALNNTFTMPVTGYKGSLLVLPTGGGKTFTSVNWISRVVLSRNIKVLWLAQSSYLLTQATQSFNDEASNIAHTRKNLKIRTVSSSSTHANSGSIELTDDVVIVTTQTAIFDIQKDAIGFKGEAVKYKPHQWIDACKDSELFVVLDEAHHAPAFGCRSLLMELKNIVPNLYILGLTATPTHNDQRIRGWLEKIFDLGICYQADINQLYASNILALPTIIEKMTGRDMSVDDKLYDRITNQHKDLPDNIIDQLANDSSRNNYIIDDYLKSRNEYGKTIIFSDRWFQCEYMVGKLKENGVKADCIYTISSGIHEASADGQGRRDNKQNEEALRNFRDGKIDVLVNVKMLTEGVDIPDVKTVVLTRNTTSGILLTQMIGRALRGKKAGGGANKDRANIVMFIDNWKRLLPFANVSNLSGSAENSQMIKKGVPPMEWISILLVQRACKDINFQGCEKYPSKYFMPVGWYETEYTVSVDNNGESEMITESNAVMAYESNEEKYQQIINSFSKMKMLDAWSSEIIEDAQLWSELTPVISDMIDIKQDDVDGTLKKSIIHIARHIAQNGISPQFISFGFRDKYDIDKLVDEYSTMNMPQQITKLGDDFYNDRLLWGKLYKRVEWFQQAYFDAAMRNYSNPLPIVAEPEVIFESVDKQPEDYRSDLLSRDHNSCCCCGRSLGKGIKLEIDHIVPVKLGGKTELNNLQILCKTCNLVKNTQMISFLNNKTPLDKPMEFQCVNSNANEDADCSVKRIINLFYRCNAVSNIQFHQRKNGKYYYEWIIHLHEGNPVQWILTYKKQIIDYINHDLGLDHVKDIRFTVLGQDK